MKFFLQIIIFLLTGILTAQVGINTTNPNATLDIPALNSSSPTNTEGILIPRVSAFPSPNPGAGQHGMMLFLTSTVGVNTPGFYYWDNVSGSWIPVGNNTNIGWKTSGNAGTNPTTNFIGTTDNQDIIFKRNNVNSGIIAPANTSFGRSSLAANTSGFDNSAFGADALLSNTTGRDNSAFGNNALAANTIGVNNASFGASSLASNISGNSNSAFGASSMISNTTGNSNAAYGTASLASNTTGSNNVAFGVSALESNTTGANNSAFGSGALFVNSTGTNNVAIGLFAMGSNTTGQRNTATGRSALGSNTTASDNSAFGYFSLNSNTTGLRNAAFGNNSLSLNTTGNFNSAFGSSSMQSNTTGINNAAFGSSSLFNNTSGVNNAAFGSSALQANTTGGNNAAFGAGSLSSNTSGSTNTAFGANALSNNTIGVENVGIGAAALFNNTTANFNVAVGRSALSSNLDGIGNTALGKSALTSNTSGSSNVALGINAVNSNTTGSSNIGIGPLSLDDNTSGSLNIAIGSNSLTNNISGLNNVGIGTASLGTNTTGSNNIGIGNNSDVGSDALTNATAIGNNAFVEASNSLVLGSINGVNGSTANVNVGIGTTTPLSKLNVVANEGTSGASYNTDAILTIDRKGDDAYIGLYTDDDQASALLFGNSLHSSHGGIYYNTSNTFDMRFRTNGNITRMTLDNTGNLGVGTLAPNRKLEISNSGNVFARITSTSGNQAGLELLRTGSTGNDWLLTDDNGIFKITRGLADFVSSQDEFYFDTSFFASAIDGTKTLGTSIRKWISIHAVNGVIQTSDAREKQNIQELNYGLEKVMGLKPVSYNWINKDIDNHSTHLGFIAQELQKTIPEVVLANEWKQNSNETKTWEPVDRLGVNYAEIIPVLVKAIQEQQLQIEELKNQIEALEKQ
ncbi:hypothetical protein A7A78_01655 [Aequorivita soesokkakensis]|uniref:Peptidase S74 domain-containing protein n=1 Tax=Aequorivita soesokkakensis TaxID=1385699 RepID=A0A1A9LHD5_9FLAO|nr:tail fiber domain-containing protein [Aequorivita soesokkakensis]OAD92640.1 hypothetical protein A7A78_01655 [Aequorivita soesokkakensis]